MNNRCTVEGLDKRKVCMFLVLVAVGLLCLGVLTYVLFFATPHANTIIKKGGNSMIRQTHPAGTRLVSAMPGVRS